MTSSTDITDAGESALLSRARSAMEDGRLAEAEDCCRRVLAAVPTCIDALLLRCAVAARRGDRDLALAMIRQAVDTAPDRADCHNTMGQVLAAMGRNEAARAAFETAVLLNPAFAEPHYNLGLALRSAGRHREAADRFDAAARRRPDWAEAHFSAGNALSAADDWPGAEDRFRGALVLMPDYPAALNNLGLALKAQDKTDAAAEAFARAVSLKPDFAEALTNLGNLNQARGRFDAAIEAYGKVAALRPDRAEAFYNLGGALQAMGRLAEARDAYETAVALRPEFPMALTNLGVVLAGLGERERALAMYRRALALEPDNPETHTNLGSLLERCGHAAAAVDHCRVAVELAPDFAEAHNNLGVALSGAGRPAEGDAAFRRALAIKPDFTEARFNHAVTRLLLGDFKTGWAAYESRFDRCDWTHIHPHRYPRPRWQGEPFSGRRLYVHDEQGFGDTIQFVRYLPLVKALGGTVILETRPPLLPLLENVSGADAVVLRPETPEPAADCDLVVPLMSLAGIFGTDIHSVPAAVPYLAPDPCRVDHWRRIVGETGFRVGLVWAGSPNHEQDSRRSIPLAVLAPLAAVDGVRMFGLQKGAVPEDVAAAGFLEANLGDGFSDFADTAAAMATLDLVISVDTAAVHLGGALGLPVWVLLPRRPDWRWLTDRTDSPWYPSLRLFRQGEGEDWTVVASHVAAALEHVIRTATANDAPAAAFRRFQQGRLDDARALLTPHIGMHPDDARALNLMAVMEHRDGRLPDALRHADAAVTAAPDNDEVRVNRGRILAALGRSAAAVADFEAVLDRRPGHRTAVLALAQVLADSDRPDAGIPALAALLAETPSDRTVRLHLSRLLRAVGRAGEAAGICREGIALAPDDPGLRVALGVALAADGRPAEAAQVFDNALARDPENADALHNLGVLRLAEGRFGDAAAAFEKAISVYPDHIDARFNLAQLHLLDGRYDTGWAGYQWRMKKASWRRRYPMGAGHRFWDGHPFEGRQLCVRHEQGLGDTLQFVRYLPMVKALGGTVILEAAPALHDLLSGAAGIDRLTAPAADRLPPADCDLVTPLMSLPLVFGTRRHTIPADIPYLKAPPAREAAWGGRVPGHGKIRAGMVWAGNPGHANDANRSIPLAALAPLLSVAQVAWAGLQHGPAGAEADRLDAEIRFPNLGNAFTDFADTAGCIAHLDIVVTVDTAVAHLAGAMGKPVWVMLPFVPDWRWRREGDDCPWYPTMRLFRQARPGDWGAVAHRVAAALGRLAATGKGAP